MNLDSGNNEIGDQSILWLLKANWGKIKAIDLSKT
jgi:hypothetical protein